MGKVTTDGVFTEYQIPTFGSVPFGITAGPDGNLWFTESADKVGKVTTDGVFTEYPIPAATPGPSAPPTAPTTTPPASAAVAVNPTFTG